VELTVASSSGEVWEPNATVGENHRFDIDGTTDESRRSRSEICAGRARSAAAAIHGRGGRPSAPADHRAHPIVEL